jgi:hypothetical protein
MTIGLSSDCTELLKLEKSPLDCSSYPQLEATDDLVQQCMELCPSSEKVKYNCCYRSCLFSRSGIYKDEKLKSENLMAFFNYTDETAKWRKIVRESVRKCEDESELEKIN